MIRDHIGNSADDIFLASMLSGLLEEGAIEKSAQGGNPWQYGIKELFQTLGMAGGMAKNVGSGALDIIGKIPSVLGSTALIGAGTGALGAVGYDAIKDMVSTQDPEEKLNIELESLYKAKTKEVEDAKWLARVRGMRDELRRNYKKMSKAEYTKKYNELVSALDERNG